MTILTTSAIVSAKVRMRFDEPYTSESVNRAAHAIQQPGIVRGFRLRQDTGANASVLLEVNPDTSDSLVAVPNDEGGFTLTVMEDANVVFDLSAQAGNRVWIFVYVDYSILSSTSAEYRVVDAAELVQSWVGKAICLGTVRVPASGAITQDHVDAGSSEYAGIMRAGGFGWSQVNGNPKFTRGLAGYTVGWVGGTAQGDGSVVGLLEEDSAERTHKARLGLAVNTEPLTESRLEVSISDYKENDLVRVSFLAKTNGVIGAGVKLKAQAHTWGAGSEDVELVDLTLSEGVTIGSYELFGFTFRVPTSGLNFDMSMIVISVGVENPANVAGQYDITSLYVHQKRLDGPVSLLPDVLPVRAVEFGAVDGFDFTGALDGRLDALLGALGFEDQNTSQRIPLTGSTVGEDLYGSLMEDAVHGASVSGMARGLTPFTILSGFEVTFQSGDNFEITAGSYYVNKDDVADRVNVIGSNTVLAVAPATDSLVYVDVATNTVLTETLTNIAASFADGLTDRIPLAVVKRTGVLSIIDIRLLPSSFFAKNPVVTLGTTSPTNVADRPFIGLRPMFTTARQACEFIRAYFADTPMSPAVQDANATILILGNFELEDTDQFDLSGLRGVKIKGNGHSSIEIASITSGAASATNSPIVFGGDLFVEDIRFISSGVNETTSALFFGIGGTLSLKNVTMVTNQEKVWDYVMQTQSASLKAEDCVLVGRRPFYDPGFGIGSVTLIRSELHAQNTPQAEYFFDALAGNSVTIEDSVFDTTILTSSRAATFRGSLGVRFAGLTKIRGLSLFSCPAEFSDIFDMDVRDLRFTTSANDPYVWFLKADRCLGKIDGVRMIATLTPENTTISDGLVQLIGRTGVNEIFTLRDAFIQVGGNHDIDVLVSVDGENVTVEGLKANVASFVDAASKVVHIKATASHCQLMGSHIECDDGSSPGFAVHIEGDHNLVSMLTLRDFANPAINIAGDSNLISNILNDAGGGGSTVTDTGTGNVLGTLANV